MLAHRHRTGQHRPMLEGESQHRFLRYQKRPPGRRIVREVAVELMNHFFSKNLSRSKWTKTARATVNCFEDATDGAGAPTKKFWNSNPFSVGDLERHLDGGAFDHPVFKLFAPRSLWLDDGTDFATNGHVSDAAGDVLKFRFPLIGFGATFPVVPELDREGWVVSSFQRLSHTRILRLHRALVETSHQFSDIAWLDDLRAYICECISLIDMVLHQLYLKAEHAPEGGWRFDRDKLGVRHGRRIADKLAWVGLITGKLLDDAQDELKTFHRLRKVRNHVRHFDPPSFACSLEGDVVSWLNGCAHVARLAWKIRRRVGAPLTEELIALLLLPTVEFMPLHLGLPRAPVDASSACATTCWPADSNPIE